MIKWNEQVSIACASPINRNDPDRDPTPAIVIQIGPRTIEDCCRPDRRHDHFANEAKKLADALYAGLPGGTIDALLVELLDRRRSELIVRHKS